MKAFRKPSPKLMAYYMSRDRVLSLVDMQSVPPLYLKALQGLDVPMASALLSNDVATYLLNAVENGGIRTLQEQAIEGSLVEGSKFIYNGHFYSKGFGSGNRTPSLMLRGKPDELLEGKKLTLEFSKGGLLNDTAYSRMSGSTNLFAFAYIAEITEDTVRAIPYLIGDLIKGDSGLALSFAPSLELWPGNVEQFAGFDSQWAPSKTEFAHLGEIPEQKVKETIAKLLGEHHVPTDWGGEESDLHTAEVLVEGQRRTGAFLLKGPAKFHPMTPKDLGKNGDQVYRLFNIPAHVYVVQHCHTISPSVRKTIEAYALHRSFTAPCQYMILDGYDTARLLRLAGEWPVKLTAARKTASNGSAAPRASAKKATGDRKGATKITTAKKSG